MYYILFIPVVVKSNDDDSVVETLKNSLEEYYITHNWEWIRVGWSIDELKKRFTC